MRVSILTNFHDIRPGYSLSGIAMDQALMLNRHGHEVHFFASEDFQKENPIDLPPEITLHRTVPHAPLTDYTKSEDLTEIGKVHAKRLERYFAKQLKDFDIAFTHDWVFTGWNYPFALALQRSRDKTRHVGFMHWVHSVPCSGWDWWNLYAYGDPTSDPPTLPRNHFLISPSESNAQQVAEQWRCTREETRCIPHIKDPRSWFEFSDDTNAFIDAHPGVLQADIVAIYPASCDRLTAKQLHLLILLFAGFKRRCLTTCLVCANQHAARKTHKENMDQFLELAETAHLITRRNKPAADFAEEFIFTSDLDHPKYEQGIPRRMLRELLLLSNLFVFPTREESFGLVAPEAALCGNFMVLNRDLEVLKEIFHDQGAYFHFGSNYRGFEPGNWEQYLDNVAAAILSRMKNNEAIMAQTYTRQLLNMDKLYFSHYEPLMQELMARRQGDL
jgi:hypothetical protein